MFLRILTSKLGGKVLYEAFLGEVKLLTHRLNGILRTTGFYGKLFGLTTQLSGTLRLVQVISPYLYVEPEYVFLTEFNLYQSDVDIYSNVTWNI